MSSLNKIILIGTIHTDPDVRATTAGDSLAKLVLLVERPERGEGLPKQSDMIPVVAWRQAAETLRDAKKGEQLLVEGRILSRSYEDAEGQRKYTTEVEARDVKRMGAGGFPVGHATPASPVAAAIKTKAAEAKSFDFGTPGFANPDAGFDPEEIQYPAGFDAGAMAKSIEEEVPF